MLMLTVWVLIDTPGVQFFNLKRIKNYLFEKLKKSKKIENGMLMLTVWVLIDTPGVHFSAAGQSGLF